LNIELKLGKKEGVLFAKQR